MPELPEVEAAARRLRRAVVGRRIADVRPLHAATSRHLDERARTIAAGRRIREVRRLGKYQLLELDGGARIVAHFRLDGDWEIESPDAPLPRFARAVIDLEDGVRIALVDPRALSTLTIHEGAGAGVPEVGPDPTDPSLDATALRARLARRRIPIKQALMDQRIVAGVGNIYAAEALWRARIHPARAAGALGADRVRRLLVALRVVLRRGDPRDGNDGARRAAFAVYDRAGKRCRRCGKTIRRMLLGGRGTYYCPGCQK